VIRQLEQLETREKLFLIAGGAILFVLLLVFGVYLPYLRALERADRSITVKIDQIKEMVQLQSDFKVLQTQMEQLESSQEPGTGLSALTLIEDIAGRIGSRENLINIRPQAVQIKGDYRIENVDVKFEKMPLSQVVRLLKGIEISKIPIQVKTLQLKQRFDDHSQLDVTMTVSSFRKNS
jgi:type II secretory pathway component PulM